MLKAMQEVIEYLEQISSAAFNSLNITFQYVFDSLSGNENVRSDKMKSS